MTTLPCKHPQNIVEQVPRTIDLLLNMDHLHPEILLQHAINPEDYRNSLVFRSAVESIRGTFIASSTVGREAFVDAVIADLLKHNRIADYAHTSSTSRHDFTIAVERNPDYFVALEVKGGEGNSVNISERPIWAREFAMWSHLDGAVVNQPAHGAHSIINRLTNELVRRHKLVDVLFFKDVLCGTRARPCPKYWGKEEQIGLLAAPDIFLFPQRIPNIDDPEPPVHTLHTLRLPGLILELFGITPNDLEKHMWQVHVRIINHKNGKLSRDLQIVHQGVVVDTSRSRPWNI